MASRSAGRRSRSSIPGRFSLAIRHLTSASTARSTPTGAASMVASIASPGRPTPIMIYRRAWISNRGCSPNPMRRSSFIPRCLAQVMSPPNRHGDEHRPLPTDRRALADHPLADRASATDPPPIHHHDQVGPRPSRSRPAEARCGAWHRSRRGVCDVTRSGNRPDARTARAAAPQAVGGSQGAECCRYSLLRRDCARCSANHGPRARTYRRGSRRGRGAGGFYLPVRLPHEVAPLFRAWLDEHYPDRAAKVMATIRSLRGGRDNDPDFFSRMRGQGPWADLLRTRFEIASKKYGLRKARFRCERTSFRPPEGDQMRLL